MEPLCEFCESAQASVKCLDCAKNRITCGKCFKRKHKSDATKAHKSVPIAEASKQTPSTTTPAPYPCSEHGLERRYICKVCEVTVCPDCLAVGMHKGHDVILFAEVDKHIRERFAGTIKELLERITKMKSLSASKKEQLADSAKKSKAKVIEALREQIAAKEKEAMTSIDKEYEGLLAPCQKIDSALAQAEDAVKAGLAKTITQDGYDLLAKVKLPDVAAIKETLDAIKDPTTKSAGLDAFIRPEEHGNPHKYSEDEKETVEIARKQVTAIKGVEFCYICRTFACSKCGGCFRCNKCGRIACPTCKATCGWCWAKVCVKCAVEWKESRCVECVRKGPVNCLGPDVKRVYTILSNALGCRNVGYFDLASQKMVNTGVDPLQDIGLIQVEKRIFIVGGCDPCKNIVEFVESTSTIVARSPPKNLRGATALCELGGGRFCAVGGCNGVGEMRSCEEYNISQDCWKPLPDLIEPRTLAGCALYMQRELYCFAGHDGRTWLNSIEKLCLLPSEGERWERVDLAENEAVDVNRPLLFQVAEDRVIIFGSDTTDVYMFDPKGKSILVHKGIKMTEDYFYRIPYRIVDTVYFVGFRGHIHTYDMKTQTYSAFKYYQFISHSSFWKRTVKRVFQALLGRFPIAPGVLGFWGFGIQEPHLKQGIGNE
eukprot:TRINITY_DN9759_c0_g1_i1.p1 TRINITY_DN9759_c0_g1~~TRINITY_DN9759_c0_g1_i1.p1  ORF type:complete len:657 (+),score=26.66 TRINITY_DN9759_c0_g1_i1:187-2157(+)